MKKLIALVIVAVMLLSMMPMMALAADGYVVAGGVKNSNTDAGFFGTRWNSSDQNNRMSQNADGSYYKKYTNVPAGNYEFKITNGSDWHGPDGNNYQLELIESSNDVVITFGKGNYSVCAIHPGKTFYVAGAEGLTGSNWSNGINEMSLVGDGIYEKTFENINKAGTYEFKVTDGSWTNAWGNNGNNYSVTVAAGENVTILFDSNRGYVTLQHTVTFSAGEGSVTPASAKTDANGKIALPIPTRDGYKFLGWAKTENGTTYVTADEVYTADATLYAQWTLDTDGIHTIAFYNGETAVGTMTTAKTTGTKGSLEGQQLLTVTAPANYTFGGWYKDLNDENSKVTTNTEFTAPTNVYAKWVKKPTLTLSFNLNGGEGNAPANASSVDGVVTLPAAPTRNGYTFNGWYDAATGGNLVIAADATTYTFTGEADASKTLYAQWTEIPMVTVYAKVPDTWAQCNIWAWGTGGSAFTDVSYPGPKMILGEDGWYSIQVPNWVNGLVLSDNGDTCKTGDITVDAGKNVWITVAEDKTAAVAYEKPAEGGGSVTPPPAVEKMTIHAKVPAGWTAVYLYAWKNAGGDNSWPGAKMAEGSEGWWTVEELPKGFDNIIVSDGNATQTVDLENKDADVVWVVLTDTVQDGDKEKYKADVLDTKPDSFKDEYAGEYEPPAAPSEYYLHGFINGADVANTTHKFVNGTITVELTGDNYVYIGTDTGVNYKTNGWLGKEVKEATLATDYANGDKLFVPAGNVTFTLVVNDDGTVKLSYAVAAPEGGNQGGTEGGNQGGNQSGTAGNPEAPAGGTEGGSEVEEITINVKVPADWENPCLWAWQENGDNDINAFDAWPGMALTKGENGWYYAKVPANMNYMIVNAHNGAWQTPDTAIEKSKCDVWAEVVVDAAGQATIKMQYTSPATGDTAIIAPVVFLMVMSVTGLAVLTVGKKKYF